MSKRKFKYLLTTSTLIGLGALTAVPSWAAAGASGSAGARYQRQLEQCRTISDHDTRANCLSEASTAYAQTQPTPSQENATQLRSNALRRCEPLPPKERGECIARVDGAGTAQGSVTGGGILYTLVTRESPPVAQAPGAPAMPPAPGMAPPSAVPSPLPPPAAGPTPGAQPSPPPIEPAPADVPPVPPQPPRGS